MTRAAVLIGVNRTGGLPMLSDAINGAKMMESWALAQDMPRKQVLLFTDEHGPVDVADIRKAIRALVDSGAIEQLIVYFAGHGVNIRYGEYWLLSDAPIDTSAAVNVEGSIVLARRCGIPHVVFISDACRTAAEGIQAQGITGSEIFPNDPVEGPEQSVDIFFGTTLGRPALEIKNPNESSTAYKAIYTNVLLDAVSGKLPTVINSLKIGGHLSYLVRPRPLKAFLLTELPQRLASFGVPATVSQIPDARITSGDDAWLASFENVSAQPTMTRAITRSRTSVASERPQLQADALLSALQRRVSTVGISQSRNPAMFNRSGIGNIPIADHFLMHKHIHFETKCGFKIYGADIVECVSFKADIDLFAKDSSMAEIRMPYPAASVLVILTDGSGILLPAVREFVTVLTFVDRELTDVAYEPSDNTWRWENFILHATELRALRSAVANAARNGLLRLEGGKDSALAYGMQYAKHIDPTLAMYAAYAYHDLQIVERIRWMNRMLTNDLGISFFDIGLLSGDLECDSAEVRGYYPSIPMLSQGWALLSAHKVKMPYGLDGIQRELLPSLWTHFNPVGVEQLRELMLTGRLK